MLRLKESYPMLGTEKLITFIPTRNASKAREFYEKRLGLQFLSDDHFAIVMDANGTMLRIVRVKDFTPHSFTVLGWEVAHIRDAVSTLSKKGIQFERYPGLEQDAQGVWEAPGGAAKVAWFKDPDGNVLSISQHS